MCWGTTGTDPGEFNIVHNIVTDDDGWVYVADRENHRVQVFDGNGKYEAQWNNMHRPCALYCCGGKNPTVHHRRAGTGHAGQYAPHQSRPAPLHRRQARARRSPGSAARTAPACETGRFLSPHGLAVDSQRRHLCRRGELHQLAEHPSRRAGAEIPALIAETRESRLRRMIDG